MDKRYAQLVDEQVSFYDANKTVRYELVPRPPRFRVHITNYRPERLDASPTEDHRQRLPADRELGTLAGMGWSFRRGVKFGPLRFNFSKSGVGASIGVPGNRLTLRSDGRVQHTVGLPGTGLRWSETLGRAAPHTRTIARALPYHPGRPSVVKPIGLLAWYGLGLLAVMVLTLVAGAAAPAPSQPGQHESSVVVGLFPLVMLAAMIAPAVLYVRSKRRARERTNADYEGYLQTLVNLYGEDVTRLMVLGDPWQGATREMIQIMYGPPNDTSTQVHKTMTRETWKYMPIDARRYALKIEFENGACVGWQTA